MGASVVNPAAPCAQDATGFPARSRRLLLARVSLAVGPRPLDGHGPSPEIPGAHRQLGPLEHHGPLEWPSKPQWSSWLWMPPLHHITLTHEHNAHNVPAPPEKDISTPFTAHEDTHAPLSKPDPTNGWKPK